MCCCDKYASLRREKRRQQPQVSPSHWEKTQSRSKAMGSTTGSSAGVNQHRAALISLFLFTSAEDLANTPTPWSSALNYHHLTLAYVKQNLTCSLMAGDCYFILQILSTLLGTMWPKWKNWKNLKTPHPDAWIGLMWASSVFGGTHYQVTAMSIPGFSSLYRKRRVFMHPTAGKLACYSTAGAL